MSSGERLPLLLGVSQAKAKFADVLSAMLRSCRDEQCSGLVLGRVGFGRFSLLLCETGLTKQSQRLIGSHVSQIRAPSVLLAHGEATCCLDNNGLN